MNEWKTVRLGDICILEKGQQIDTSLLDDSKPYRYINGGIKESGYFDNFNTSGESVLISEGGASCGYINYVNENFWCGCHCYRLHDIKVYPKYLFHALKANQQRIMALRTGSAMPNIQKSTIQKFELKIHDNSTTQKKVSILLDKCNELIEKHKQTLEKYDMLIKSRFIEMFGDPVKNPLGWEVRKLKETTDIITGNTPSRKDKENYGTFIEWIKTDNITDKTYITTAAEYLSEKGEKLGRTVEPGSILMACIAGSLRSIGRVALTDRKVAFNQQINAIVPKQYNILFLYVLFQNTQSYAQSTVNMALKGILSKGKLEELEYILPPIKLQNDFAAFVQKIDGIKSAVQKSLNKAEILYKSLMQLYFV